ncbi:cyclin CCL1 [Verticillium dahliae]|nr:cyclin CCL1 [Verticillium dahliae]
MATEDARYRLSSQFRLWSYPSPKLADLREKTNALAAQQISTRLRETKPEDPLPEFLTAAEETVLLKFFTVELIRAAIFCDLPTEIRATAAVFLRRFYITNSVMTYPPTDLLKTCLFFGGKAEGYFAKLSKLADKFPNTTEEEILAGEFLLCQGIRFAFDVRHPFRGLEGTILELRRHSDIKTSRIDAAHQRAREILKFSSLVTDAYFHYTPSQIMLAALSLADEGLCDTILDDTFAKASGDALEVKAKLTAAVRACKELLSTELPERMQDYWGTFANSIKPESMKLIRPLVKKLKKCRDPDRADLVALQKARREAAASATAKEKEVRKGSKPGLDGGALGMPLGGLDRDTKRRKVTGDDVFGGAL